MKRPDKVTLLSMYTSGMNDTQVAGQYKVSRQTIYRWRKEYGIEVEFKRLLKVRVRRAGEWNGSSTV
jgi:transposase